MSLRSAHKPIDVPKGISVNIADDHIEIKSSSKKIPMVLPKGLQLVEQDHQLWLKIITDNSKEAQKSKSQQKLKALLGTFYALLKNNLDGAHEVYKKKLILVGVGYRAQAQGNALNLTLGFSHPVVYQVDSDIKVETPSQTEVVLSSSNKQLLGQTAAEICAYRPVEIYKGKGIRPEGLKVILKETKKK